VCELIFPDMGAMQLTALAPLDMLVLIITLDKSTLIASKGSQKMKKRALINDVIELNLGNYTTLV
jgi:hypothetical protein